MICMKNLRFSSRPRAKVRRQGPPGSARAQPWSPTIIIGFPNTYPLDSDLSRGYRYLMSEQQRPGERNFSISLFKCEVQLIT